MTLLTDSFTFRPEDAAPPTEAAGVADVDMDDLWLGETMPDLEKIPEPQLWNVVVKQIAIKRKVGSILLPDQTISDQEWTHGMCLVVKTGPAVYRGRKFEDIGITPEMGPKPGDVYKFRARHPERIKIDGETFIELPDDALSMKFDRRFLSSVSFKI